MSMVHSGQEAVIPTDQTAWVVLGSSGQWSDWSQWVVAVYAEEQDAKDYVGSISAAVRQVMSEEPSEAYDDSGERTPEYLAWVERLAAIDPLADQYDQPNYTAKEVPFFNNATTANSVDMSEANAPSTPPVKTGEG